MTVGDRAGSVSQVWSVDTGGISISRRSNRAGTGSSSLTLHGTSFGLSAFTRHVRVESFADLHTNRRAQSSSPSKLPRPVLTHSRSPAHTHHRIQHTYMRTGSANTNSKKKSGSDTNCIGQYLKGDSHSGCHLNVFEYHRTYMFKHRHGDCHVFKCHHGD